jgi:hypothetical protein
VPDTVKHKDRDSPELGALLELLHRGGVPFTTVRATYRIWRHDRCASAAFRADIEERKSRGASISLVLTFTRQSGAPPPDEHEEMLRVWRDGDRVREEREGGRRAGAYGVRSGDVWWSWDPAMGAVSNQDDPNVGGGIGEEISVMLDPTPLLGVMKFAAVGHSTIAGRATLRADATARPSDPRHGLPSFALHRLGTGADHYTLEIDLERAVLLEAVAIRDGKPCHRITTVEVVFDDPIPDERFHFEPPAGEEIQPSRGRLPQRLSVPEAQQRAPFTVLIPDRLPANWRVHCYFIEASARPPQPAHVSLLYSSNDGHESVSLSQSSATDSPSDYERLTSGDAWHDVEHDGTVVRVTKPGALGPQAQAHLERDGTSVLLTSQTLNSDQLAKLAAGLKRAPPTSSIQWAGLRDCVNIRCSNVFRCNSIPVTPVAMTGCGRGGPTALTARQHGRRRQLELRTCRTRSGRSDRLAGR